MFLCIAPILFAEKTRCGPVSEKPHLLQLRVAVVQLWQMTVCSLRHCLVRYRGCANRDVSYYLPLSLNPLGSSAAFEGL